MVAQTLTWWVFLALTQYASSSFSDIVKMEPGSVSATEGSCFEIKCAVPADRKDQGAYWVWKKEAQRDENTEYSGDTVIYSSDTSKQPISPEFEGRVQYFGSSHEWKSGDSCTILICDLKTSDNGNYSLKYEGSVPLMSPYVHLTIKGNPCPLTFDQPPAVKENNKVTLTCSTSTSCPSEPRIQDVSQPGQRWQTITTQGHNSTTVTFSSNWDDNGRVFSCQTWDNTDKYLIRNITVTVEYPPIVEIKIISPWSAVKRRNRITVTNTKTLELKCDVVRSSPQPAHFTWTRDGRKVCQTQTYTKHFLSREDIGLYTCAASNKAGEGTSALQLDVPYRPRETRFYVSGSSDNRVKVEQSVTFTCDADASPAPTLYTWYHSQNHQSESKWKISQSRTLTITVQRAYAGCYSCTAWNSVGTGDKSSSGCLEVLYPPSQPRLEMPAEVKVGDIISVHCSAESFPQPTLTLIVINQSNRQVFKTNQQTSGDGQYYNINSLYERLQVTPAHAGLLLFRCSAQNTEGTAVSEQKLVVRYAPINVRVTADPGLTVKETELLTLSCSAECYPPVSAVTWMKTIDGRDEIIQKNLTLPFTVHSASPSDSGLYSCETTNPIGSGKSQRAEVEVKYAPKNLNITESVVSKELDGRSYVTLSCMSHSVPPAHLYSWHRKIEGEERDEIVSKDQNYTVYSDKPGLYFCTAENEVDQRSSDPVPLFEPDNNFLYLRFIFIGLLVLVVIIIIIFLLRHRRKKYQQATTNTTFFFAYMQDDARRRRLRNELITEEPFRSRDNLLSVQMSQSQRHQPVVDNTPRTHVDNVYSLVDLSQVASAQKPKRQQAGHTKANSTTNEVNYASLHFGMRPKVVQSKAEEHTVYAAVSKPKNNPECTQDYENVAAKSPSLSDDDEGDVNYLQVSFAATPRPQVTDRDSSSSGEDEIQYSDVRI